MMVFDAMIIGGGASGMSCALILGSAGNKEFAKGKKIALISHQRASHLDSALFNNVLGFEPGTLGKDILKSGLQQIRNLYPQIEIIEKEKVITISENEDGSFTLISNKDTYTSKIVVVAVGYAQPFTIDGLEIYLGPHPRAKSEKNRVWLKNNDHLVTEGLYVAGTLAGWRSQYAMACGSGAHVATDILTLWNQGQHVKIHDKN